MSTNKSGEHFGWVSGVVRNVMRRWQFLLHEGDRQTTIDAQALQRVFLCHPGSTDRSDSIPGYCQPVSLAPTEVKRLEDVETQWFGRVYSPGQDVLVYRNPERFSRNLRKSVTEFLVPAIVPMRRFLTVELGRADLTFIPDPLGAVATSTGDDGYLVNKLIDRTRYHPARRLGALGVQRPEIRRAYTSFFETLSKTGRLTFTPPAVAGAIRGVWVRIGSSALLVSGEVVPVWPAMG